MTVVGCDLGGVRFDHQVADSEDKALVVDDNTGPLALAAEDLDRASIRVDERLHLDDGGQKLIGRDFLREECATRQHYDRENDREGNQTSTHAFGSLSAPIP